MYILLASRAWLNRDDRNACRDGQLKASSEDTKRGRTLDALSESAPPRRPLRSDSRQPRAGARPH